MVFIISQAPAIMKYSCPPCPDLGKSRKSYVSFQHLGFVFFGIYDIIDKGQSRLDNNICVFVKTKFVKFFFIVSARLTRFFLFILIKYFCSICLCFGVLIRGTSRFFLQFSWKML